MTISDNESAAALADAAERARGAALALTLSRLVAAPIVAGLVFWGNAVVFTQGRAAAGFIFAAALLVFLAAACTDFFDGRIARAHGAVTATGAALDHVADKVLTTAALFALAVTNLSLDMAIAAGVLIARDMLVAGLREGLGLSGRALPVDALGKTKTVILIAAIGLIQLTQVLAMLAPGVGGQDEIDWVVIVSFAAQATLMIAAVLSVWSGAAYLMTSLRPNAAAKADLPSDG
jgi:cardiolipin synthase